MLDVLCVAMSRTLLPAIKVSHTVLLVKKPVIVQLLLAQHVGMNTSWKEVHVQPLAELVVPHVLLRMIQTSAQPAWPGSSLLEQQVRDSASRVATLRRAASTDVPSARAPLGLSSAPNAALIEDPKVSQVTTLAKRRPARTTRPAGAPRGPAGRSSWAAMEA